MDSLSWAGATALAGRIRLYWLKKGVSVEVWVESVHTVDRTNHEEMTVYQVRSNLSKVMRERLHSNAVL